LTNYSGILARLPNVFSIFNEKNYFTSFHYGGDMDFANIGALFTKADKVSSEETISSPTKNAWGIHDEILFDDFYSQITTQQGPYFSMLFSLSSHEPYVVPNYAKYKEPYQNSVSYTDSCLGVFLNKFKKTKQWNNTLIIITADHGSTGPDHSASFEPRTFQIPLVITGGAVKKNVIVDETVGQADIPVTLGKLIHSPPVGSAWQHSLLQPNDVAYYSFYNGIGLVNGNCSQQYDIYGKRYIDEACSKPFEQAYFQMNNQAFFSALSH
jgi:phosphoglycerol transferase MdoB-like AlkP superfamily enzyme